MLTLDQAREALDSVIRQARLTREEHSLLGQALELLYDGAKEHEETPRGLSNA